MRAAYEQTKIIVTSRSLSDVIADPKTPNDDKVKLQLVKEARDFTEKIGLSPGDNFTTFTQLSSSEAAWVISGSAKDKFKPYTWWFPVVGSLPYRGYFDRAEVEKASRVLAEKGIETWARGTDAFSTLGWFKDPLLSSTLRLSPVDVVNVVIHETVHATIWVPGSVGFNESLANYVGHRANIDFFKYLAISDTSPVSETLRQELLQVAERDFENELINSDFISALYEELNALYLSSATLDEKLQRREETLQAVMARYKTQRTALPSLKMVNNAEILQRKLYLTKLRVFDALLKRENSNWQKFFERIIHLKEDPGDDEEETLRRLDKLAAGG